MIILDVELTSVSVIGIDIGRDSKATVIEADIIDDHNGKRRMFITADYEVGIPNKNGDVVDAEAFIKAMKEFTNKPVYYSHATKPKGKKDERSN